MTRLSPRLLCQLYGLLVLLAATIAAPAPYFAVALALLLVMLFTIRRPLPAGYNIVTVVVTLFLLPLLVTPMLDRLLGLPAAAGPIISALAVLPWLYLLDYELRQAAWQTGDLGRVTMAGRHTTPLFRTLLAAMLVMLLVAAILGNAALFLTTIIFALYLLGVLGRILVTVPRLPLGAASMERRVIAGSTASIPLHLVRWASGRILGVINATEPWVRVVPPRFVLSEASARLEVTAAPPLAGPVRLRLHASVVDQRGFVQVNQPLEPVTLSVIPRAKYAQWLAMRYLEQTGDGMVVATRLAPKAAMKGGSEYHDSRHYQPGDRLKDIDWKHSLKLSKLVVKEYVEAGERAVIVAVNLSVADAEEADRLAFRLLTLVLTLAQEGIPTALAAYDYQRVVLTTAVTSPRQILRQALSLVGQIGIVNFDRRYLSSLDICRLRRNITHLKQVNSEASRRLVGVLDFEYRALEEATRKHPATVALAAVTERAPVPAVIALVSQLNHDAEALMVATERLSRRRFSTLPLLPVG